tara:strand:+ start:10980 stop:11474 length:495 start_codon:yes stop_codon:yes gene_type:complete
MKKSVLFALAICVSLLVFESCESAKEESAEGVKTEVLAENKESVQMKVDGMVCAMGCAKYIQEQVADLNGVVASNVNFEEGSAVFEFDKSVLSATEIESFINEIHDGQYSATIADEEAGDEVEKEIEVEVEEEETEKKVDVASVSQNLNISLPKLFTYFLKALK